MGRDDQADAIEEAAIRLRRGRLEVLYAAGPLDGDVLILAGMRAGIQASSISSCSPRQILQVGVAGMAFR